MIFHSPSVVSEDVTFSVRMILSPRRRCTHVAALNRSGATSEAIAGFACLQKTHRVPGLRARFCAAGVGSRWRDSVRTVVVAPHKSLRLNIAPGRRAHF